MKLQRSKISRVYVQVVDPEATENKSASLTLYETAPVHVITALRSLAERGPEMAETCEQLADLLGKRHEGFPLVRKLAEFFAAVAPDPVAA